MKTFVFSLHPDVASYRLRGEHLQSAPAAVRLVVWLRLYGYEKLTQILRPFDEMLNLMRSGITALGMPDQALPLLPIKPVGGLHTHGHLTTGMRA